MNSLEFERGTKMSDQTLIIKDSLVIQDKVTQKLKIKTDEETDDETIIPESIEDVDNLEYLYG